MNFLTNIERKYQGRYVAITNEQKPKVIASGKDCGVVIDKARQKGQQSPCIIFVPKENVICIY